MASPFRKFRRHQKVFLALLGVAVIIAFVILPPIMDMLGTVAGVETPAVRTKKYGDIKEDHLRSLVAERLRLRDVFRDIAQFTLPKSQAQWDKLRIWLDWLYTPDEEAVVDSWLLSRRAEELGLVCTRETAAAAIEQLHGGQLGRQDLLGILKRHDFSELRFIGAVQRELQALHLHLTFLGFGNYGATPAQRWDYYKRLNQRATVELVAIPVANYVDRIPEPSETTLRKFFEQYRDKDARADSPTPGFHEPYRANVRYFRADRMRFAMRAVSEEEIIQEFQRDPLNYQRLEAEAKRKAEQQEAEIRKALEKLRPQLPEEKPPAEGQQPDATKPQPPSAQPDESSKPDSPSKADTPPKLDTPSKPDTTPKPDAELKPDTSAKPDTSPKPESPVAPKPESPAAQPETPPAPKGQDETGSSKQPQDPQGQSAKPGRNGDPQGPPEPGPTAPSPSRPGEDSANGAASGPAQGVVMFAAFVADESSAEPAQGAGAEQAVQQSAQGGSSDKPTDSPSEKPDEKQTAKQAEKQRDDQADNATESGADKPAEQSEREPAGKSAEGATDKPGDKPAGGQSEKAGGQADKADKPADEPAEQPATEPKSQPGQPEDGPIMQPQRKPEEQAEGQPQQSKPEAKQQPVPPAPEKTDEPEKSDGLSDYLRSHIRYKLGYQKLLAAFGRVEAEVNRYRARLARKGGTPPVPLDFVALAEENGLETGETGLIADWEAVGLEIARVPGFFDAIFSRGDTALYVVERNFDPKQTDPENQVNPLYIYFKVDQTPERTPQFDDPGVYEQVLQKWREIEARQLAREAAERVASAVRKSGQSLSEYCVDRPEYRVSLPEPFTWLTRGLAGATNPDAPPRISPVDGVEMPGEEFMRTVFGLEKGGVGTAMNAPQTCAYVIRLISFDPASEELLWERFAAASWETYRSAAAIEDAQFRRLWTERIREEAGLKWQRRPQRVGSSHE